FPTRRTARYFTLEEPSAPITQVWIACHGYGQLAEFFVRYFEVLKAPGTLVVAPEAMNRFYLNGTYGRVGATWMTKEDRLTDIDDYVHYLDQLYHTLAETYDLQQAVVNVFGFSQGGATVCRWVANRQVPVDNLILWAGTFPLDFNVEADRDYFNSLNIQLLAGDEDEYANSERLQELHQFLQDRGIQYRFTPFKGKHTVVPEVLRDLAAFLAGH
ncbi:MAG: dienelactone hydrolase family protein, partial [Bacteroidota bacterium]